jgi:arylformamidase
VRIVDISLPLHANNPTWPGSPKILLHWTKRLDAGAECNNSRLECDTHVGTHVDAPLHFLSEGTSVDKLPLEMLVGPAVVAYLPEVSAVTAGELEKLALPSNTRRLLLRTRNSEFWAAAISEFTKDYVSLTCDAAHWLVRQGVGLVGVDYFSVGSYEDGARIHQILLEAGVIIVESLNLAEVQPGNYELICLPICLAGAEAAPARAVLVRYE